jgi:hypothetical protein
MDCQINQLRSIVTMSRETLNEGKVNWQKMGAVAPTLFGAIKLLVNNQTCDF